MSWKQYQPGTHWRAEYQKYEAQLREMIGVQKLTQEQVANLLGKNRTTIQRWCYRFGIQTQRTGPRGGAEHPDWKGGQKLLGRYRYIYCPDHPHATKQRYVAEHRLVMEQKLGRHLLPSEVVHHRDGDPLNNAPDNLEVFQTNGAHLRHELNGRVPKWTEDGQKRLAAAVEKAASIRRGSKAGAGQRTRSTARQPS
jgi:hypothetical protein